MDVSPIINSQHFDVASRILTARMCRPTTMDVGIINREFWHENLEAICNRYIGCFDQRSDGRICFYLVGREHPDGEITHLFVYYINSGYTVIQDLDIQRLKPYLPNMESANCCLKIGVIDIKSSLSVENYLSILIEVIDFTVGSLLIEHFVPFQIINTDTRNLAYLRLSGSWYSRCEGILSPTFLEDLKRLSEEFKSDFHLYEGKIHVDNPGFGLIRVDQHVVGFVFNKHTKIVDYILIHSD